MITIVRTESELRAAHGGIFVPTMGALHAGHFALVREAARLRDARGGRDAKVVVSIFVNPTQFNDPKDLERYPRTLEADAAGCAAAGADVIFAPEVGTIYAPGTASVPPLPAVATEPKLEDAHRPGHFAGVCQVVKRLFELVRPTTALFGEKDWQQLQVVRAITREQSLDVEILGLPTIREPDGLAMSSRNVFLTPEERVRAVGVIRALREGATQRTPTAAEAAMHRVLKEHALTPEYAVSRHAENLCPLEHFSAAEPARLLIAVRLEKLRLIDNLGYSFFT